jgi:hypothetical protein
MKYLEDNCIDISPHMQNDDIEKILEIIDDAIVDNIVDNDDEPDEIGIHLQRIYDRIKAENRSEYEE